MLYQYLMAARTDPNLPPEVKAGYTPDQRELLRLAGNPSLRPEGAPRAMSVPPAEGMGVPLTIDSLRAKAMSVPNILPAGGGDEDGE